MAFEINLPSGPLTGTISAHLHEPNGVAPRSILEADKDFEVHITWTLDGPMTPFIAGTWLVSVSFESIGPGLELRLPDPPLEVPLTPDTGPVTYDVVVPIPANTLRDADNTVPYKMVTTVAYRAPNGRPGPMAGFVESNVIQIYVSN